MAAIERLMPGARLWRLGAAAALLSMAMSCWAAAGAGPVFATHAQAGAEYSQYVAALQSKLLAAAAVAKLYFSRLRHDFDHSDLQAPRTDSHDLLTAMQNANNDLAALAPAGTLHQRDSRYFDAARDAAQAMTSAELDMARDLAGSPDVRVHVNAVMRSAARKQQKLRRKFESTVLHGYRYFGHVPADIDMSSLALKP